MSKTRLRDIDFFSKLYYDSVKELIINDELVVEHSQSRLVIQNGSKLSEVLKRMPSGIIDKKIPGIGATTLELRSERSSIIVVPTKSIAASKAKKHNALYVGSDTILFSRTTNNQIISYINDEGIEFKKIIVVADSIPRVMNYIKNYDDWFLMVDEIDSFQSDSIFRSNMEIVMDYYFDFKRYNRCLVSSTIKDFSNPMIDKFEMLLEIDYDTIMPRNIQIFYSNNPHKALIEIIESTNLSNEKILIAYNSIKGILQIIEQLTLDIKVLCSDQSKDSVGKYFGQIGEDGLLPAKINFMTSAYFTGIDIEEKFHCISFIDARKPHTMLSIEKLKQIAGRGREGLLSEIIIHNYNSSLPLEPENLVETLKNSAIQILRALDYVKNAFEIDVYMKLQMNNVRKAIMDSASIQEAKLVRENKDGKLQISYLTIDSLVERINTQANLYTHKTSLFESLKYEGYDIIFDEMKYEEDIEQQEIEDSVKEDLNKNRNEKIEKALSAVEDVTNHEIIKNLIYRSNGIERNIYNQYLKLLDYFDPDFITEKLRELNINKSDSRAFKNFYFAVAFEGLPPNNIIKQKVYNNFNEGEYYNVEQIFEMMNKIFSDVHALGYKAFKSTKTAVTHLRLIMKLSNRVKEPLVIDGKTTYKVQGKNPFNLHVKKWKIIDMNSL